MGILIFSTLHLGFTLIRVTASYWYEGLVAWQLKQKKALASTGANFFDNIFCFERMMDQIKIDRQTESQILLHPMQRYTVFLSVIFAISFLALLEGGYKFLRRPNYF